MSFAEAALVEPISVSLGGVQRSDLKFGQPVLVCGAGPIGECTGSTVYDIDTDRADSASGLNAVAVARAAGAYPILVTDIAPHRLESAKALGADLTLCCELSWDGREISRRIRDAFEAVEEGLRPEVALECTGVQSSFYGAGYGKSQR